jgi:hypothetical protein
MTILNKLIYNFFHSKCLASLFLSKNSLTFNYNDLGLKKLTLIINTIKFYDINLLTINGLWFLLFGQYPKGILKKKLIKYRKSKISFLLTFSKKKALYTLIKIFFLAIARQDDFQGYFYKTDYFIETHSHWTFPIKTLSLFFMIDFLYGQQPKNLLTVKQKLTINIDCSFINMLNETNAEYLYLLNLPFFFETSSKLVSTEVILPHDVNES